MVGLKVELVSYIQLIKGKLNKGIIFSELFNFLELIKSGLFADISSTFIERKKRVNAHNYAQWIGVEKDLSVIEPHTIYFVNITVMKKETLRLMKNEFILSIFNF